MSATALRPARPVRKGWRPGPVMAAWAYYILAGAITLVFLFPLAWVLLSSVQPTAGASALPIWLPSAFTLENYATLTRVGADLWNSLAVALGSSLGVALVSTLAAYGFSRFRFAGQVYGLLELEC